jgi:hypothetical protein
MYGQAAGEPPAFFIAFFRGPFSISACLEIKPGKWYSIFNGGGWVAFNRWKEVAHGC